MKNAVASLVLVVATAPALAADASGPAIDKLVACADLTDSLQRLVCFDREIAPLKSRTRARAAPAPSPAPAAAPAMPAPVAPPPAVAVAPAPTPPAPTSAPASFGQEQLSSKARPAATAEEQALHARITTIRGSGAAFVVSLDNGQTWRHEDLTLGAYLKEGEAVTIRKGTLGSYRLTRDDGDSKNWIRVTRVR